MAERLTCSQSHTWNATESVNCPICGGGAIPKPRRGPTANFVQDATIGAPTDNIPDEDSASDNRLSLRSNDSPPTPPASSIGANFGKKSMSSLNQKLPHIPGYELLGVLGRGGMGVVYQARQDGLDRMVAIKMILAAEHAGSEQRARFETEAKAVARLQHPHIVQIYEVSDVGGRPYFSLEFVNGGSLAGFLMNEPEVGGGVSAPNTPDTRNKQILPNRLAADLIEVLARAMHVAHEAGIIHRDLKPANVLLHRPVGTIMDTVKGTHLNMLPVLGIPKITDFGLAKTIEHESEQTQAGSVLGTPSYMAPEQAAGKTGEITRSVDIYALGVMLYEVLTGRPPFVADSPFDIMIKVMRDEPVPPRDLVPKVARDLDIICLKALDKNPKHRYLTALELAEDLRRYLDGEPILARAATPLEKVNRWVKRHPAYAGMIVMAGFTVIGLVISGITYQRKIESALALAETERDLARTTQQDSMARLIRMTVSTGSQSLEEGDYFSALLWFAEALRLQTEDPDRQEMHRIRIASVLRRCPMLVSAWFSDAAVVDATFTADGKRVITASADGNVCVWDAIDPTRQDAIITLTHPTAVREVRVRPDGQQVLTLADDGKARLWKLDGSTRTESIELASTHPIHHVELTPDGKSALTISRGGHVHLWDTETGKSCEVSTHLSVTADAIAFSFTGDHFVVAQADGVARVWNTATLEPASVAFPHPSAVVAVGFSPDGTQVVTGCADGIGRTWDIKTGKVLPYLLRHADAIRQVQFNPDGNSIVTGSDDSTVRVWNARDGQWVTHSLRHGSKITVAQFSPDGRWLVTGSEDNTARVWNARTGDPITSPLPHNGTVNRALFSPDGTRLITTTEAGVTALWEIATPETSNTSVAPIVSAQTSETSLELHSPDRRSYLAISKSGSARIYDSATRQPITPELKQNGRINHAAYSTDSKRVVTGGDDSTAQVWDATTGEPIGKRVRHGSSINRVAFAPDGQSFATASNDNTARVWQSDTGEAITPPLRHRGTVARVQYSSDGRCLMTAMLNEQVRIWDARSGEMLTPTFTREEWSRRSQNQGDNALGWDLPADGRSTDNLVLLSQWLIARKVDPTGGLVALPKAELEQDGVKLRGEFRLTESFRTAAQRRQWHYLAAEQSEKSQEWFAARFHLDRLLAIDGDLPELLERRGRAFAELGMWGRSAIDYQRVLELCEGNEEQYLSAAMAALVAGDRIGMQKTCEAMHKRFDVIVQGDLALRMAWPGLLGAGDEKAMTHVEMLINQGEQVDPDRAFARLTRGFFLYRTGKYEEAAQALRQAQVTTDGGYVIASWLLLAATYQRMGKAEESKQWHDLAERWLKSPPTGWRWQRRMASMLLHQEVLTTLKQSPMVEPLPPGK